MSWAKGKMHKPTQQDDHKVYVYNGCAYAHHKAIWHTVVAVHFGTTEYPECYHHPHHQQQQPPPPLKTVIASSTEIHVFNSIKLLISPPKSPNFPSKNSPSYMVWGLARTSKMIGRSNQGSKKWTPWGPMCFSPLFRWGESAGQKKTSGLRAPFNLLRKCIFVMRILNSWFHQLLFSPWVFVGEFSEAPKNDPNLKHPHRVFVAKRQAAAWPTQGWIGILRSWPSL